jgi:5'-3' exonuclease
MQKKLNTINELKIIIITNDGDYLQMYSNNVKIFNMQLKDLSLKINYNPAIELLLKIIMGDKSDNIPKIQAGMRKDNALKIALMSEDDRIKYLTLHNMLDNFNLNKNLIDLDEIPEIIVKNFYEYYNISIQ